jgi:hypothetical protein
MGASRAAQQLLQTIAIILLLSSALALPASQE